MTPPRFPSSATATRAPLAAGFGTIDLYVQPANLDVTIDGQRWVSSDEGHFLVQVPVGRHHIEVTKTGFRQFTTDVEIGRR